MQFCLVVLNNCSTEVLRIHISGQPEVFEGVEGDVSMVHHRYDYRDISALESQKLYSLQIRHGVVKTGTQQDREFHITIFFLHFTKPLFFHNQ